MRIRQRRRLRNQIVPRRLLIRRRRADKHKLLRPPPKHRNVPLNILRRIRDPIHHHIKVHPLNRPPQPRLILYIRHQTPAPRRRRKPALRPPPPPVQQIQLHSPLHRHPAHRRANKPRPPNKQHPHLHLLPSHVAPPHTHRRGQKPSFSQKLGFLRRITRPCVPALAALQYLHQPERLIAHARQLRPRLHHPRTGTPARPGQHPRRPPPP